MKQEEIKMEEDRKQKVEAYARSKYKMFEKKTLIIKEYDNIFTISTHKDASPLILGKGII